MPKSPTTSSGKNNKASPSDGLSKNRILRFLNSLVSRPRHLINFLLLVGFCADWVYELLYWFPKDAFGTGLNYWAYTDWLIDYSHGFIRRGLSGEVWRFIPDSISTVEFTAILSWTLVLAAAFGYLRLAARSWKTLHPLTLFGLLFLPSLFVFYLHDHNAIARKEILGYLTVLLHLFIVEKYFPPGIDSKRIEGSLCRYVGWLLPVSVIFLPAIILVHEANFLMFVPLHGMITLSILRMSSGRGWVKAALWTGLAYLPAALTFGIVYLSGTPSHETLLAICEKWLAAGALRDSTCVLSPDRLSGSTLPGSFIPMEWTLREAATYTRMIVWMNMGAWLIILPVLGFCLWYLVRQALYAILRENSSERFAAKAAKQFTSRFYLLYFLIPLVCSLPIYFTAYDYGRWFTVTSINFAMLAVSANLPLMEFAFYKEDKESCSISETKEHLDSKAVFYGVSILICLLALVLWLPHYCLFECDILRSPLEYFAHTFVAN